VGKKRKQKRMREWEGPRCSRPGINRSMSGITEATNSRGIFTLTLKILDAVLPDKYPKAKCPTANVGCPSSCHAKLVFCCDFLCWASSCSLA